MAPTLIGVQRLAVSDRGGSNIKQAVRRLPQSPDFNGMVLGLDPLVVTRSNAVVFLDRERIAVVALAGAADVVPLGTHGSSSSHFTNRWQ
jgi:hypothetical protein